MSDLVRRMLGRARPARPQLTGQADNLFNGIVEVFERREIAGWLEVAARTGPVRVDLCINGEAVAKTWAAPQRGRRVHGELLQFRFTLSDLWKFTKTSDEVSVRIAGRPLPIVKKGTFYRPRRDGIESLQSLRQRLSEGYVFCQNGRLQLSKTLDHEWQNKVLSLYGRVNQVLDEVFGVRAFLCYGTLLGAVRDNGFIGHDLDFDSAFVTRQATGRGAVAELADVSLELITRGFNVIPKRTCLAVKDEQSGNVGIDLYHFYRDTAGNLNLPFGIAGDPDASRKISTELRTTTLGGHDVFIPADAERLVEITYGTNWRTPNPGFRWQNERTTSAREGIVPREQVDEIARVNVASLLGAQDSSVNAFLDSTPELPHLVVEIGSVLGDQATAFARTGRRVVAIERSSNSNRHAQRRLESHGVANDVELRAVDFYDANALGAALKEIRGAAGGPIMLYARSYPEFSDSALRAIIGCVDECSQPGDVLLADFRGAPTGGWARDKAPDAVPKWTLSAFSRVLSGVPGWSVEHAEAQRSGDNDATETVTGLLLARRK